MCVCLKLVRTFKMEGRCEEKRTITEMLTSVSMRDFMSNMCIHLRPSKKLFMTKKSAKTARIIVILLLLLLSGDIEKNPGPNSVYPCGYCERCVNWSHLALCCDECNIWYHKSCLELATDDFRNIEANHTVWFCFKCFTPNYSDRIFNSFYISTSNQYSVLSDNYGNNMDLSMMPDDANFAPMTHSTPVRNQGRRNTPIIINSASNTSSFNKSDSKRDTNGTYNINVPRKHPNNLRFLTINCNSCLGKKAEIDNLLHSTEADIIFMSETKIDSTINPSEFLPPNYKGVIRKDRCLGGGGVMIAVKQHLVINQLDIISDAEIAWGKVSLYGYKDMYVGSFYRQPKGPVSKELGILESMNNTLHHIQNFNRNNDKTIILSGDFNASGIDWETNSVQSGASNPTVCSKILDILDEHGLSQLQKQPTRESNILDLFCSNKPGLVKHIVTIPGISDHDIIMADCSLRAYIPRKPPRKIKLYSKADWINIHNEMREFKDIFLVEAGNRSPEQNFELLKDKIEKTLNKYVPSKMVSSRYRPPWLNTEIKRACRKKQRLYNKARRSNKTCDWTKYKDHKREVTRIIRGARSKYINDILEEGLQNNDSKPFWKYIKSLRHDGIGVAPLKHQGELHSNSKDKAEILSDQFRSVFTKDDQDPFADYVPTGPSYKPIEPLKIEVIGVFKLLKRLKINKASGPDNLTCRILKELAEELAPCLTIIFNQSLELGKLPTDWRCANITPLFKKGNRDIAGNYRPVSLTSIVCKTMEHIICSHIRKHLDNLGILSPFQHGFRKGHSCESQLQLTMHHLNKLYDKNTQVDIAVLDFSKAFDVVPHRRLLRKLELYGINGNIHAWIAAFLQDRTQSVVVDGDSSNPVKVESGVPQGTLMGPLLFLLHINDLPQHVTSFVRLFADDCLLYRPIYSVDDQILLQKDLNALQEWGKTWGMKFNASKCNIMRISRKKSPLHAFYDMSGEILKEVQECKYLGINISNNLKWNTHIAAITKKAQSSLGFIRRNTHHCPAKTRELAYLSMVRPSLEYCASVWDPGTTKNKTCIENVQKRSARMVKNDYRQQSSITSMLKDLKWNTLEERRKTARLVFMFKIIKKLVAVPMNNMDLELSTTKARKKHEFILKTLQSSTEVYKQSFIVKTIKDWNNLTQQAVGSITTDAFKKAITSA